MKKYSELNKGDFVYCIKVNSDPLIVYDCVIQEILINPIGVVSKYHAKLKILFPDGSIRYFYVQNWYTGIGKIHLHKDEFTNDIYNGEEFIIGYNRNELIDNYIDNANKAIDLWNTCIENYTNLINKEKERINFLNKQRHD